MHEQAKVDYHFTAQQYSKLAVHYDDMSSDRWHEIARSQGAYIDNILKENSFSGPCRILNMTCGRGTQLLGLAEYGHKCTGLDLSEEQISKAKQDAPAFKNGESVNWILGDALNAADLIPQPHNYDAILSFGNSLPLLGSLENIEACFSQAYKLLKPGGLLILTGMDYTPHRQTMPHIIQHGQITGKRAGAWIETARWMENGAQYISHLSFIYTAPDYAVKDYPFPFLYALTAEELENSVIKNGFTMVTIKPRDDLKMENFYICIARKKQDIY